jgi:YrbI family 3-deoxy-D-manno-octulosonate 8-phosphate phosphatase
VAVALISLDDSPITTARAAKLGIQEVHQGCSDKVAAVRDVLARLEISAEAACFVGDDTSDLGALALVGFSAAPADAVAEVREAVQYVTSAPGGRGAVREIAERLLRAIAAESPHPGPA